MSPSLSCPHACWNQLPYPNIAFTSAKSTTQGHVLYPTAKCLSDFLAEHADAYIKGKRVLELGAGGGLPSLVSALEGAEMVGAEWQSGSKYSAG